MRGEHDDSHLPFFSQGFGDSIWRWVYFSLKRKGEREGREGRELVSREGSHQPKREIEHLQRQHIADKGVFQRLWQSINSCVIFFYKQILGNDWKWIKHTILETTVKRQSQIYSTPVPPFVTFYLPHGLLRSRQPRPAGMDRGNNKLQNLLFSIQLKATGSTWIEKKKKVISEAQEVVVKKWLATWIPSFLSLPFFALD